jgi:hypothetical protein
MEMAEMTQLEAKATDFNCPSAEAEKTLSFAGLDIAQQAVTLIQSTLGFSPSTISQPEFPVRYRTKHLLIPSGVNFEVWEFRC